MNSVVRERKNIGVLFGGRSAEHEISVISGLQAIDALDVTRFNPVPIYIASDGRWYTGSALLARAFYRTLPRGLEQVEEVTLMPKPGSGGLTRLGAAADPAEARPSILPIDAYLLVFHGQYGEDGCIQGLLEMADVPYTGCNVLASSVAMNKYACKALLRAHGIPVLPGMRVYRREAQKDFKGALAKVLSAPELAKFPLFVKPCNLGSSIGVSRAASPDELGPALAKVFRYDLEALVEPCVTSLMEINVSVIDTGEAVNSVVEIPVSDSGVLTYEEKYLRGGGKKGKAAASRGMASLTRVIDPETLDAVIKERVQRYAREAFSILGCSGVVRFDFIMDTSSGELYFNELNPIPGSLSFYLWVKSKPQRVYTEVLSEIIERAAVVHAEKSALRREIGFKALK